MVGNTNGIVSLRLVHNLPFVSVEISANSRSIILHNVLLDTGSATSVFSADKMVELGLFCAADDNLYVISGIGGEDYVFSKTVDSISIGHLRVTSYEIEIGALDYGFQFDAIIGMNFLRVTNAKIDCENLVLT
ncbi:MAG: clan AA aspartic protease [Deltaproteobacteria bacterium]|nr:clan AA aspartic protease [Deltaproteobacteria bacterium]